MIEYIILIISLIYLFFKGYKKVFNHFWSIQPVFHIHNIFNLFKMKTIINPDLPKLNKYCNLIDIKTNYFEYISDNTLIDVINFLKKNYTDPFNGKYICEINSFKPYFESCKNSSFVSIYNQNKILNYNNSLIDSREIVGVVTSRPVNITFKNNNIFPAYLIDNLCSNKNKDIEFQLIQTHEYFQRHNSKNTKISLFKCQNNRNDIVPLVSFEKYNFTIDERKYNNELNNMFNGYYNIVKITEQNINLFINFVYKNKEKFTCLILPDYANLLNLIKNENIFIYVLLVKSNIECCYIFRNSNLMYNNNKSIECFASINNSNDFNIFVNGFYYSLMKINKILNCKYLLIETLSHNNVIIDDLYEKFHLNFINPYTYLLYNYIHYPLFKNEVFALV